MIPSGAGPLPLPASQAALAVCRPGGVDVDDPSMASRLSEGDRTRARSYATEALRSRFMLGRVMLQEAAAWAMAVPALQVQVSSRRGKAVQVIPAGVQASVSYAEDLVVVLLHAAGPVGVDVEDLASGSEWERLAASTLSSAELEALRSSGPSSRPRAFVRLWTAKEAVSKAMGLGLDVSFAGLEPEAAARRLGASIQDFAPGRDQAGTLVVPSGVQEVQCWLWTGPGAWTSLGTHPVGEPAPWELTPVVAGVGRDGSAGNA